MPDIFDEVSEDLRAERTRKFLFRYAGVLVGAAILVLAGVGAWQAYGWYQHRQAEKAALAYLAITDQLEADGHTLSNQARHTAAQHLLAFAADAPAGYGILARLRAAGLLADAGDLTDAEAQWDAIANDDHADQALRQLANLLWAEHALGSAPDDQVAARLGPLAGLPGGFRALAQETQALLYIREGKTALARTTLTAIASDPAAPDEVRNRADGLLLTLNG